MKTGCKEIIEYQELSGRKVISPFNGGQITSDAGGLFLREIERACPEYIEGQEVLPKSFPSVLTIIRIKR